MMNQVLRKTFEPGRIYKIFIRQHQFKPKDKSIAFDAPLPKDLQVFMQDAKSIEWFGHSFIASHFELLQAIIRSCHWISGTIKGYITFSLRES